MVQEKNRPHYSLRDIKAQMTTVEALNLTGSALDGITDAGMDVDDALEVIQSLKTTMFYKSMTTYANHSVWQDVYRPSWNGLPLYVKIQRSDEYFVISFKER